MGILSSSITHPTHVIYAFSQRNLNINGCNLQGSEFYLAASVSGYPRRSWWLTVLAFTDTRIDQSLVIASTYSITLHVWRYLSILGIPERRSIDLINNVTRADKLVDVSLTTRHQVKDEDTSTEIPEWQTGQWCSRLYRSIMSRYTWWKNKYFVRRYTNLNTIPTSRQGTTPYVSHTCKHTNN